MWHGIKQLVSPYKWTIPAGSKNGKIVSASLSDHSATLLDSQISYVLIFSLFTYITLTVFIGIDKSYSAEPICHVHTNIFSGWINTAMSGSAVALVLNCITQLLRLIGLLKVKKSRLNMPLIRLVFSLLVLSSISASSQVMTFLFFFGGVCRDVFG